MTASSDSIPRYGTRRQILPYIAGGGAAGTLCRGALDAVAQHNIVPGLILSWSTIAANLVGAFLLGYLTARLAITRAHRPNVAYDRLRLLLGTGFLGAFTTYSTFALVTAQALPASAFPALFQAVAVIVLGILVAGLGMYLGSRLRLKKSDHEPTI